MSYGASAPAISACALKYCVGAIWAATLGSALLVLAGIPIASAAAPHDALPPTASTTLALLAHNACIALWPLALVAIGWPGLRGVRVVGDLLIVGQLISHGVLVGSQIGQHPDLWRYLPHLPFEWLAIAMPSTSWLHARTPAATPRTDARGVAVIAGACLVTLATAAVVETYLVPVA